MARVWVAMSGGVDSSVAAALLLEQGHDVTGVTMQLWPSGDEDVGCCTITAIRDARRVCDLLGITHYTLNFRDAFEREVIGPFAEGYAEGTTPNPCIECNDRLKFSLLLPKVLTQGADALATGHYSRIIRDRDGEPRLARGVDSAKDQSYFLYRMTRAQMSRVRFPVGELTKSQVRAYAARFGLPVSAKAESQDTCFEVHGAYEPAVATRVPHAFTPGEIVSCDGTVVGTHRGIAAYTVGQRKGLGIGGSRDPLYVVAIVPEENRVVVGTRSELDVTSVEADRVIWHAEPDADVDAVVRYRMQPVPARASFRAGRLRVTFVTPLQGAAPGQSVVCYRGDVVLGGGVITCAS